MNNNNLLKLREEKNNILTKMNILLEDLQNVEDEDEKDITNELIKKLKLRLEMIDKQIDDISKDQDSQQVESQEESDDFMEDENNKEEQVSYDGNEQPKQQGDGLKVYIGRKENGNILAYYDKSKKDE